MRRGCPTGTARSPARRSAHRLRVSPYSRKVRGAARERQWNASSIDDERGPSRMLIGARTPVRASALGGTAAAETRQQTRDTREARPSTAAPGSAGARSGGKKPPPALPALHSYHSVPEARGASRHLTIEGARASKRSVRLRGVATGGQGTKSRVPISEGPSESLSFVCPFTEDLAFIFSEFRTQL